MTNDGYKLNFRFFYNSKPPIILVHGLCMEQNSWYHQINNLKDDYSILTYDLRGHGKSDKPSKKESYSLDKFIEDIDILTNNVGLDKFILMGFSLGGSISLEYAQLKPEKLNKIITINAPYSLESIKRSFFIKFRIAKIIPPSLIGIGLDDKPIWDYQSKLDTHRKTFMQSDIKVISKIMESIKTNKPKFKKLNMPHLLIYSSNDEIVKANPPKGLNSVLINGGHHYVLAQKSYEVNSIIRKFLK